MKGPKLLGAVLARKGCPSSRKAGKKMEMRTLGALCVASASTLVLAAPLAAGAAEDRPTPELNLFSVEQDVEIGRSSAAEAERQLPMLNDRDVDRYLNRIVARLADQAPGGDYPYTIKAVNAPEINAFSLPGGPMYVSRGLIQAARSEAELVGALAHEMSHVALRHGTHHVSKAYLAQAGLGILDGLLGRKGDDASQIVEAVGGLGLNVAFLEFSRDDEYQADLLGAEMMAGARYDPVAMADFFELLRSQQGSDPGRLERFLGSHPPSADREARIREQARSARVARAGNVGAFDAMRKDLRNVSDSGPVARRRVPNRENPASRQYAPAEGVVDMADGRQANADRRTLPMPGSGHDSTTATTMRVLRTLTVDESTFLRGPQTNSDSRR